ncbi:P-loop containing nucleoside triphosphate hydrolase protein [Fennellomyces sp. T-0311]|nr:P-loop containing nucleoside triphosphate hydrolase protein [Fennellomyces sp. T-0311]
MTTVPVYHTISKKALFARLPWAHTVEVPWAPVINPTVNSSTSRHTNPDEECASKMEAHGGIDLILSRSRSNTGKVMYQVRWQDGTVTQENVAMVRKVAYKLFEAYEHKYLKRQRTRYESTGSPDSITAPVSRRRTRKKVTWADDDDPLDNQDDMDKENHGPLKRRRVESIAADELKPRSGPWSEVPYYLDDKLILEHWDTCLKCQQEGYPNGTPSRRKPKRGRKRQVVEDSFEMSSEEEELLRGRLLLCITCAAANHEGCISQQKIKSYKRQCYDQDMKPVTQFQCNMCASAVENIQEKFPRCDGCHKVHRVRGVAFVEPETTTGEHVEHEEDTRVLFRCRRCTRAYHYSCIPGSDDDEGRGNPLHENHWACGQCARYSKSVDVIVTWRIAGDPPIENVQVPYDTAAPSTRQYLIKWQDTGYTHMDWVSETWLNRIAAQKLKHFANRQRHQGFITADEAVPKEWMTVERILTAEDHDGETVKGGSIKQVKRAFVKYHGLTYDEIYWDTPPPEDSDLYPHFCTAFENYKKACALNPPDNMQSHVQLVRGLATKEHYSKHELKQQPEFVRGGNLMPHQLDGLNWLIFQWERNLGCVLADDMGLGKTIQIVTLLNYLLKRYEIFPFVVVVPLSTATNWLREFARWAPDMVVVPYYGSAKSRQRALHYEIFRDGSQKPRCHAVVLTYESAASDTALLSKVRFWPLLVVDEAQRLKNDSSLLFQKLLRSVRFDHPILMTGTPLQNNIRELINIMHFVDRKAFADVEELEEKYNELSHTTVQELHDQLKPYFLRRTKEVILKTLPPKSEIIVPVSMSSLQKEVYKDLLEKNLTSYAELTTSQTSKVKKTTLANTLMQLRKTLGHPYLLPNIEIRQKDAETTQHVLVEACAKLKVLHQMLPKLKKNGHRVLIFSTFKGTLDILEDYLAYEKHQYVRVDGETASSDRVASIDKFNVPDSEVFVFLLTTRAGGVGINLATADTVIMWDFDFNPHADLQAICRAYRIGQTKPVLVLRFMTRLSVEEKIAQMAKKKMVLDHLVVDKMDDDDLDENDVESIIKFGAQALFEGDDSKRITYDSAGIDKLLDRSKVAYNEEETVSAETAVDTAAEPSSKPMSFSFAKVWNLDKDSATEDLPPDAEGDRVEDDDFWAKFLEVKKAQAEAEKQKKEELGRGARKRAVVNYSDFDKVNNRKGKGKKDELQEHDPDYEFIENPDVDEDLGHDFEERLSITDLPPPDHELQPPMPQPPKHTAKRSGKKKSPPKDKGQMPYPAPTTQQHPNAMFSSGAFPTHIPEHQHMRQRTQGPLEMNNTQLVAAMSRYLHQYYHRLAVAQSNRNQPEQRQQPPHTDYTRLAQASGAHMHPFSQQHLASQQHPIPPQQQPVPLHQMPQQPVPLQQIPQQPVPQQRTPGHMEPVQLTAPTQQQAPPQSIPLQATPNMRIDHFTHQHPMSLAHNIPPVQRMTTTQYPFASQALVHSSAQQQTPTCTSASQQMPVYTYVQQQAPTASQQPRSYMSAAQQVPQHMNSEPLFIQYTYPHHQQSTQHQASQYSLHNPTPRQTQQNPSGQLPPRQPEQ